MPGSFTLENTAQISGIMMLEDIAGDMLSPCFCELEVKQSCRCLGEGVFTGVPPGVPTRRGSLDAGE